MIKDKKSERNKKFDLTLLEFSRIELKSKFGSMSSDGI
jgi:hypothetical protein